MQNKVKKFNEKAGNFAEPMPVNARIFDIQSEMGELCKEHLKSTNYGSENFKLTEDFKMEYGDTLYSMLSLANELDINANDCLKMALKKYEARINKKSSMGSGN